MSHVHQFSVMIVKNGFVVQESFGPAEKTLTLVARNVDELVEVLKEYIKDKNAT